MLASVPHAAATIDTSEHAEYRSLKPLTMEAPVDSGGDRYAPTLRNTASNSREPMSGGFQTIVAGKGSKLTDAAVSASLDAGPLVTFNEHVNSAGLKPLGSRAGTRNRNFVDTNAIAAYGSVDEEFVRLKRHLRQQDALQQQ